MTIFKEKKQHFPILNAIEKVSHTYEYWLYWFDLMIEMVLFVWKNKL